MEPDGVVIEVTEELVKNLVQTNEYHETYYYAHNNGIHRITWVFTSPAESLIGCNIIVKLSTCYGPRKIALPQYKGKSHLKVRMVDIADPMWEPVPLERILKAAPRNDIVGRKPMMENTTIIKASVPTELAEFLKRLGDGNISAGVRLAGHIAELRAGKSSLMAVALLAIVLC